MLQLEPHRGTNIHKIRIMVVPKTLGKVGIFNIIPHPWKDTETYTKDIG